jgi:hypothetical protein
MTRRITPIVTKSQDQTSIVKLVRNSADNPDRDRASPCPYGQSGIIDAPRRSNTLRQSGPLGQETRTIRALSFIQTKAFGRAPG